MPNEAEVLLGASVFTVTLNPSIDRTIALASLKVGAINRAGEITLDPGGKGVNVSRAAHAYGAKTHAIFLAGHLGGSWMSDQLRNSQIPHTLISAGSAVRSNMTIVEENGTVTKINEPGSVLSNDDIAKVKSALEALDLQGNWVLFAGRLNPGASPATYSELAEFVKSKGALVAVDTSGEELASAVKAQVVDLIKPNHHELAELVSRPLTTIQDVIDASREVIRGGVRTILCSMGSDGAILITEDSATHCEPLTKVSGTPVGAGDILLSIFISAGCDSKALEAAVQWSAASVPLPGTSIPTSEQAAAIEIASRTDFDRSRVLVEGE